MRLTKKQAPSRTFGVKISVQTDISKHIDEEKEGKSISSIEIYRKCVKFKIFVIGHTILVYKHGRQAER